MIKPCFQVHYLSHAMMFCMGVLIEAHVVLTPATCVIGERYKFNVVGGTHKFLENAGVSRGVHHLCIHKGKCPGHLGHWSPTATTYYCMSRREMPL